MLGEVFAICAITADDPQLLMLMKWRPYRNIVCVHIYIYRRFDIAYYYYMIIYLMTRELLMLMKWRAHKRFF